MDLERVLWIGGPPGAGKTTVARRLARRHGLRLYSADTRTWEHRDRALAAGHAAAERWESLAPEAVAAQVRSYHARPWATGDPEAVVCAFVCECGDRACHEELRLPLRELSARPVLAHAP